VLRRISIARDEARRGATLVPNALSFASLAHVANRKGHHAMAALAAAGAWLFGVTGVLFWFWR